jgi:SAM-dependent methyltransferase
MTTPDNYFNSPLQRSWNAARVKKLVSILGEEWFLNKNILEVGCGHGNNGKALISFGAKVTFTDGRQRFVDFLKAEGFNAYVMDQDKEWSLSGNYDLIIHWGVLYHLDNWKQDLKCALDRAPLLCLESEIHGSPDPLFEKKNDEIDHYDQALNRVGTLVSAKHLENYIESLGATFVRYDDEKLNAHPVANYSWKEEDRPGFQSGQRRFWMIRRSL